MNVITFGVPYSTVTYCPLCGEQIYVQLPDDDRFPEVIFWEAEKQCWLHFSNRHRFRMWLYRKTGRLGFLHRGIT